jgi:hypothetical protein
VLANRTRALAELARDLRGGDREGGAFQDRRPGPAEQGGELIVGLMIGRFQAFPYPSHAVRRVGEAEGPWLAVLEGEVGVAEDGWCQYQLGRAVGCVRVVRLVHE